MLLESLTAVIALYCFENEIDNCPEVHHHDLSNHGSDLYGCYGRTKDGKRVIIIDDDMKGDELLVTFYHEFGHFIEEIQGDNASAHGVGHKQSVRAAKGFTRRHR